MTMSKIILIIAKCFAPISIVIIAGNLFILLSISLTRKLRKNYSNYLIASLSLVDLITGLVVIPIGIYHALLPSGERLNETLCKTSKLLNATCFINSMLHLLAITIDRYYHIKEPLKCKAKITKRITFVLIIMLWTFSIMASLAAAFFEKHNQQRRQVCSYYQVEFTNLIFVITFILPCTIALVAFNVNLYKLVRTLRRVTTQITISAIVDNRQQRASIKQGYFSLQTIRSVKAAIMISIVVVTFFVSVIPASLSVLIMEYTHDWHSESPAYLMWPWLIWLNSAVNPLIYLMFSADLQNVFISLFSRYA